MRVFHSDVSGLELVKIFNGYGNPVWVHEPEDGVGYVGPMYPTLSQALAETAQMAREMGHNVPYHGSPLDPTVLGRFLMALGKLMWLWEYPLPTMLGPKSDPKRRADLIEALIEEGFEEDLAEYFCKQDNWT